MDQEWDHDDYLSFQALLFLQTFLHEYFVHVNTVEDFTEYMRGIAPAAKIGAFRDRILYFMMYIFKEGFDGARGKLPQEFYSKIPWSPTLLRIPEPLIEKYLAGQGHPSASAPLNQSTLKTD